MPTKEQHYGVIFARLAQITFQKFHNGAFSSLSVDQNLYMQFIICIILLLKHIPKGFRIIGSEIQFAYPGVLICGNSHQKGVQIPLGLGDL